MAELTADELARANDLLVDQGVDPTDHAGSQVFNDYSEMLSLLEPEERSLVLQLTEDYMRCRWLEYSELMLRAFASIPSQAFAAIKTVVVLPLAETGKNGKPKSSAALVYPCRYEVLPSVPSLASKKLHLLERLNLLPELFPNRTNTLLVFVDDFIGSGNSALKTIKRYRSTFSSPDDEVLVIALVAQQQGLDVLTRKRVPYAVAIKRSKGITDSVRIANKVRAHRVMARLERRLGVPREYRRGYRRCEALITMMRTPNNTFPVFWYPHLASGARWPAPFRREA